KVVSVLAGEAQAVHGAGVGGDNLGGELGLEGVGGMQSGDRGHRGFIARGAIFRRVSRQWREGAAECREDFARDGGGKVGKSVHRGSDCLMEGMDLGVSIYNFKD